MFPNRVSPALFTQAELEEGVTSCFLKSALESEYVSVSLYLLCSDMWQTEGRNRSQILGVMNLSLCFLDENRVRWLKDHSIASQSSVVQLQRSLLVHGMAFILSYKLQQCLHVNAFSTYTGHIPSLLRWCYNGWGSVINNHNHESARPLENSLEK